MKHSNRYFGFNAQGYREYLKSLTLASNPDMQKKIEEYLVEDHIKKEVRRYLEEIQLQSVGWVGGYIQIGQKGLEFRVPFVDPDVGYA